MPRESALGRALGSGWTAADHITATTLELSHAMYRAIAGLGGNKIPPLQIDRPTPLTGKVEPPRRNNPRAFASWLRSQVPGGSDGE